MSRRLRRRCVEVRLAPAFEYHYPHLLERLDAEAHAGWPRRARTAETATAAAGAAVIGGAGARQGDADPDPGEQE